MRIAQIIASPANAGTALFYCRISLALHQAGQTILPVSSPHQPGLPTLRDAGLTPVDAGLASRFDLFTRSKLRIALKTFRTSIAIAWTSRAAALLPPGGWLTAGRVSNPQDLKNFRNCQHFFAPTSSIAQAIIDQGIAATQVHHLPNFVTDFAGADPASRAALDIPEQAPLLLGLGRLDEASGYDILIRAAAILPDIHCIIAGAGPERAKLQSLITSLHLSHRVKLLGWRDDPGALLKTADIFVCTARSEPPANTILEAFAAQTPVLAVQSAAAIITHGADGILVPVNDAQALADAARHMLADVTLRVKLALAARQRFAAEFSATPVTAAWLGCLQKLAG